MSTHRGALQPGVNPSKWTVGAEVIPLFSPKTRTEETMTKRRHTEEFKREVVRQLQSGEKRLAQVCREHQLDPGLVRDWRKRVAAQGDAAFARNGEGDERRVAEKRIADLERLVGQLTLEREFLKKACRSAGLAWPKGAR